MLKYYMLCSCVFTMIIARAQEHSKRINILFSKNYQPSVYEDRIHNVSASEVDQITKKPFSEFNRRDLVIQTFSFDKNNKLWISFYECEGFFKWYNPDAFLLNDVTYMLPISSYALYKRNGSRLKKISTHHFKCAEVRDALNDNLSPSRFLGQIAFTGLLFYFNFYVFQGVK